MTTGIILLNIGTPQSTKVSHVRRYLREFLSDPMVIDIPALPRWLLVNAIITPFRAPKSAEQYRSIWYDEGSPLLVHSQRTAERLQAALGDDYRVVLGMRYGEPSIKSGVKQLLDCERILLLPMFPQYATASSESALIESRRCLQKSGYQGAVAEIKDFCVDPGFINAVAKLAEPMLQEFKPDMTLMSYHGLPQRQVQRVHQNDFICPMQGACPALNADNRDCYRAQCYASSQAIAQALQLAPNQYQVAFQSRLGRIPWIPPYTDEVLPELYQQGARRLAVLCPSFVADCLETLEEIGVRAKEQWLELGGEELLLIPCVNESEAWITGLAELVQNTLCTSP